MSKKAKVARYGSKTGLPGPKSDFAAPIVKDQPIAATDSRQYLINTRYNEVPDEYGITNKSRIPRQQMVPANGGKYSGRTGPI
jgi:hypothetical protein